MALNIFGALGESYVYAITGNKAVAKLAWRAKSVQDLVGLIKGDSPIIDNEIRILKEKQKYQDTFA